MSVLRASCACGQARLTLEPPLLFASHCHCASCRRSHGAPFVTWTAVPRARMTREGATSVYASSPGVERHFCPDCGTHVLFLADGVDRAYVPVALLLDGCPIPVEAHVSIEERPGWVAGLESLPCFVGKSDIAGRW